jgi:uncharacterized transporter YbjL
VAYPELAIFFALAIGFWIGPIKVAGFSLGNLTAALLAAVVIGQLAITISPNVKSVVILLAAQTITLIAGKPLFRTHPGILLGVVVGAGTATPALATIQEIAKSSVPTLGYGVSYAVGNVFLALWGTVIVLFGVVKRVQS